MGGQAWDIPNVYPPLGLAYIAAVLEREHKVCILDAAVEGWRNINRASKDFYYLGLDYEEIGRRIKRFSPDVVGITVPFSLGIQNAFKVASVVKESDKDIFTMLGGHHPTVRPLDCAQHPSVDFVVVGEGEHTVLELVKVLEKGADSKLDKVKGIAYKKQGVAVQTRPRPFIQDIDSLPFPARHLIPMELYYEAAKAGLGPNLFGNREPKPWTTMITSRGCPYSCVFCSIHLAMGRKWRPRSPELVVDEIEQLVHGYRIKQIDFEDDNIALDKKRMERICDLVIERGLDFEWYLSSNGIRADSLDENLVAKMEEAGCRELSVSPESGVQRVVDHIVKKNLDLRKVEEAVKLCKKVGIKVGCFFVIGLIGETKEDIRQTIRYAKKLKTLGVDGFCFSMATPYYETELFQEAKQKGYLIKNFHEEMLHTRVPCIETEEFTARELYELYVEARLSLADTADFFSPEKIRKAVKDPQKALELLVKKIKMNLSRRVVS